MTKSSKRSSVRLIGGSLIAVSSLFLCGSTPATTLNVVTESAKTSAKESQFALATVNDVCKDQRSEMIRLAAKYPQLFIQASAGQLNTGKTIHR